MQQTHESRRGSLDARLIIRLQPPLLERDLVFEASYGDDERQLTGFGVPNQNRTSKGARSSNCPLVSLTSPVLALENSSLNQ